MSLKDTFTKLKKKGEEYFVLDKEKIKLESEIKNLKTKYKSKSVGRDAFSVENKKLVSLMKKMDKKRKDIENISQKIGREIEGELADVIS
ncbi:MAG: hypothetical protein CMH62_02315 [Nanoarchaeota archaeon]|nr:hypothetical protein [Nanoarchaeota archaeon]|tara:strand:- start:494 stop:763 length:270 start_codon:yes stop_codon:yes gene_type:complete